MGHPDFRVAGKIFATLGWRDPAWGVVKLTPEDQGDAARDASPSCVVALNGAWGRRGWTRVNLAGGRRDHG